MKIKIIEYLKNKFKTMGFSDKAFEAVADYLSKSITKDEELETGTAGVEALLKGFQGDIDRRVTEAVKTTEEKLKADAAKAEADKAKGEAGKDKTPAEDEPPAWAKKLIETNESLAAKVASMEGEKIQGSYSEKLKAKLTEAKVPDTYSKAALIGRKFASDEEVDTLANELVTGWKQVEQDFADKGLGQSAMPQLGSKNAAGVSASVASYVEGKTKPDAASSLGGKELKTN